MSNQKDNTDFLMNIVYVGILAFIIIAIIAFAGKDAEGHGGFQIIFNQGPLYIASMIFFALVAAGAAVFGISRYRKTQKTNSLVAPGIIMVIFLAIAFGKGCTDKANDGVTGPKGRPVTVTK
jgi:hypothetical protein